MESQELKEFLLSREVPYEKITYKNFQDLLVTLTDKWRNVCEAMGCTYGEIKYLESLQTNKHRQRYRCEAEKALEYFDSRHRNLSTLYKFCKEAKVESACNKLLDIMFEHLEKDSIDKNTHRVLQRTENNDDLNRKIACVRRNDEENCFYGGRENFTDLSNVSSRMNIEYEDEQMDYKSSMVPEMNSCTESEKKILNNWNASSNNEIDCKFSYGDNEDVKLSKYLKSIYDRPDPSIGTFPFAFSKKKKSSQTLLGSRRASSVPSDYRISNITSFS